MADQHFRNNEYFGEKRGRQRGRYRYPRGEKRDGYREGIEQEYRAKPKADEAIEIPDVDVSEQKAKVEAEENEEVKEEIKQEKKKEFYETVQSYDQSEWSNVEGLLLGSAKGGKKKKKSRKAIMSEPLQKKDEQQTLKREDESKELRVEEKVEIGPTTLKKEDRGKENITSQTNHSDIKKPEEAVVPELSENLSNSLSDANVVEERVEPVQTRKKKKKKKKGANKTINQDELQPVEEEMENLNSNDFQRDPSERSLDKRENASEQPFEVAPTQKTEEHMEPIVPELEVLQSPEKTEEETKEQTI